MSPEEDRTHDAVDSEPKHYQLSYSGPSQTIKLSSSLATNVAVKAVTKLYNSLTDTKQQPQMLLPAID